MKNFVIVAIVIILIVGGVIWYQSRTPEVSIDETMATTTEQVATSTEVTPEQPVATTTDKATSSAKAK